MDELLHLIHAMPQDLPSLRPYLAKTYVALKQLEHINDNSFVTPDHPGNSLEL
jgi:hypothetical protein